MKLQVKPSALLKASTINVKNEYQILNNFNENNKSLWYISLLFLLKCVGVIFFLYCLSLLCKFGSFTLYTFSGTVHYEDSNSENYTVDISWAKCGTDKYGKINLLEVNPNPISLHKNLMLKFEGEVFENISAPLTVKVKVEKKFWFQWITIPCLDSLGSCTYPDVCMLSPWAHDKTCDLPIPNSYLPCKCPIEEGTYYANKSLIHVEDPVKYLPKWLKNGKYRVRVTGFLSKTNIGCYEFKFAVSS